MCLAVMAELQNASGSQAQSIQAKIAHRAVLERVVIFTLWDSEAVIFVVNLWAIYDKKARNTKSRMITIAAHDAEVSILAHMESIPYVAIQL